MTEVTRAELEACARLLGHKLLMFFDGSASRVVDGELHPFDPEHNATDREALARAAKLKIDYENCDVGLPCLLACDEDTEKAYWFWPADGTESACIIKASAAVQIEREKGNG